MKKLDILVIYFVLDSLLVIDIGCTKEICVGQYFKITNFQFSEWECHFIAILYGIVDRLISW